MTNPIVNEVRSMAYSNIEGLKPVSGDPLQSLMSLDWNIPLADGPIDQKDLFEANQQLSPSFCLGRAARAAAFAEKWFPDATLQYVEVREDFLRNMLLKHLSTPPVESELTELLSYEEPHAVIMVNGHQFDPICIDIGYPFSHPWVSTHPVWEGFASILLVERARFAHDRQSQLSLLAQAEQICPDTAYVTEARVDLGIRYGEMTTSKVLLDQVVLEMRPTARSLFTSSVLGNESSKERFLKTYPAELFQLLENELEANYEKARGR